MSARALPLFSSLPNSSITWLDQNLELVAAEAGQTLIEQGDPGRDCFFILEGSIQVDIDGNPVSTATSGAPVGELALFSGRPRSATVRATSKVRALRLPAAAFDELVKSDPSMGLLIEQSILGHLAKRFEWNPALPSFTRVIG